MIHSQKKIEKSWKTYERGFQRKMPHELQCSVHGKNHPTGILHDRDYTR